MRGDHGEVGAEEDFVFPVVFHVVDEFGGKAFGFVSGGIDVDVREFGSESDHLVVPGVADVTTDNFEIGEVEGDALDMYRTPGF